MLPGGGDHVIDPCTSNAPTADQALALRVIRLYAQAASDKGGQALGEGKLALQARRSACIAHRLRQPGLLVLNDPVGTGKTIVALAAGKVLLDRGHRQAAGVDRLVIVAPSDTIARAWAKRARQAGLNPRSSHGHGGAAPDRRIDIVTTSELAKPKSLHLPKDRSRVLFIVDEAHRGLHNPATSAYQAVSAKAKGAKVLLVTATPFQMRPSGLELMLEIDGDDTTGDRISVYGRAIAKWLKASYDVDFPPAGSDRMTLDRVRGEAAAAAREALIVAKPDLDTVLMPTYPRKAMGMPRAFAVPKSPLVVPVDEGWALAYHAARLLPELMAEYGRGEASTPKNSDAYMRMLNSSLGAWQASAVYKAADSACLELGDPVARDALTRLLDELDAGLGPDPLDHPKVSATAQEAIERATADTRRHVLVFCEFVQTQEDLEKAITALASGSIRVEAPNDPAQARKVHRNGFAKPVSPDNRPIIMVVRDNLSESIDLDGGHPVVIHHDLSWSPVRWTQRMGRVVRASSGFQPVKAADVVVPILDTHVDHRLWQTLRHRNKLMNMVIGDDDALRELLDSSQPDWDFIE
jgi:hypothetical protein